MRAVNAYEAQTKEIARLRALVEEARKGAEKIAAGPAMTWQERAETYEGNIARVLLAKLTPTPPEETTDG